jgi:hypothetical protein
MGIVAGCPQPNYPSRERPAGHRPTLSPSARAAKVKAMQDKIFFPEHDHLKVAGKRDSSKSRNKRCFSAIQRTLPDLWAALPASHPSDMDQAEGHVKSTSGKRRAFRPCEYVCFPWHTSMCLLMPGKQSNWCLIGVSRDPPICCLSLPATN